MTDNHIAVAALKNRTRQIVKEAREALLQMWLDANDLKQSPDTEIRLVLKDALDGLTKAWKALP